MALATTDDIGTRLGRSLSEGEIVAVELLLTLATGVIAEAADKTDEWLGELDPVPVILRALTVEVVCRALANPNSLDSLQEGLGASSYNARFRREGGGLMLTDQEGRLVRSAVYGTSSGSSTPRALHDRLIDLNEGRDVDEIEA